jgi:hypothetical protein
MIGDKVIGLMLGAGGLGAEIFFFSVHLQIVESVYIVRRCRFPGGAKLSYYCGALASRGDLRCAGLELGVPAQQNLWNLIRLAIRKGVS